MKNNLKKTCFSAMFLAMGIVLPLFTSQIKEIGDSLLPMHIPVMLCGFICGPWFGLAVGFVLPFMRSIMFSMPPAYPNAVWMSLELATYGIVIGALYKKSKRDSLWHLYFCLIASMLSGRIVWGIAKTVLLGLGGKMFSFNAFITGGFVDASLGIILQLLLIPSIMKVVNSISYHKEK